MPLKNDFRTFVADNESLCTQFFVCELIGSQLKFMKFEINETNSRGKDRFNNLHVYEHLIIAQVLTDYRRCFRHQC